MVCMAYGKEKNNWVLRDNVRRLMSYTIVRTMFFINRTVTLRCMVWAQAPQYSNLTCVPPIKGKY